MLRIEFAPMSTSPEQKPPSLTDPHAMARRVVAGLRDPEHNVFNPNRTNEALARLNEQRLAAASAIAAPAVVSQVEVVA